MTQADDNDAVLDAAEESELLAALEAALRPGELDAALNERLIERALEDPLAPPSEEELVESARLRDALEAGAPHQAAATLAALKAAFDAAPGDQAAVERAVTRALPRRGNVIYAVFGAAGAVLAAAAALVLVTGNLRNQPSASAPSESVTAGGLAKPRSTTPLFSDRFETDQTTARMDLIASERGRDLRDNRYAAWGAR